MGGRGGVGKLGSNGELPKIYGRRGAEGLVNRLLTMKDKDEAEGRLRSIVNPQYIQSIIKNDDLYTSNCSLSSVATILNQMGYEVTAGPRDFKTWRGAETIFDVDWKDYKNYLVGHDLPHYTGAFKTLNEYWTAYNNPNQIPSSSSRDAVKYIINVARKEWGKGAIAEVGVKWKDGGAHSMTLVVTKTGAVRLVDGQVGKIYTPQQMVSKFNSVKLDSIEVLRVDHLKFRPDVLKNLRKMVKPFKWTKKLVEWDKLDAQWEKEWKKLLEE